MSSAMPELREFYEEQKPGCCVMCDEPLPTGRTRFCSDPCKRAAATIYHRVYYRHRTPQRSRRVLDTDKVRG